MKSKALPFLFATLVLANSARADIFTWDGGAGTWDTTTANWGGLAWGNTNADEAIFGGTAGTVNINTGSGVTANKLTFNYDAYIINGNVAADVLTLAGTTPTVTIGTGLSATIDAIIAGSSGLTKTGAGTLVLNGANTYTGTTTVSDSGGTLVVANIDALSGAVTLGKSTTLRLATDTSVNTFTLTSGTNVPSTIIADRATSGTSITQNIGSTTIGYNIAKITFQKGGNVTGTATVTLASLLLNSGVTYPSTLNPTTANVTILGNVTRVTGASTRELVLDGTIAGNAINGTINNYNATALVALTKSNTSTWTLNNTGSNYTGITTISGGVLEVAGLANGGSNSSIGASTNAASNLVFGASGAALRFIGSTSATTDRSFTTSSGTGGGATIDASGAGSATLTIDDIVAIAYGTNNQTRTLTLDGTNTGANTFTNILANNGTGATSLNKNGTGTWVLDGTVANTHTGTTAINGGTLILAKTGVNAIGGNVTVGNADVGLDILQLNASDQITDTSVATFNGSGANAGIFQLNNQNETLAGLVSSGGAGIVENGNATAGTSTLTLSFASGTQTFSGILQDNGGSGSGILTLTKAGAGTQALTGTSTYTGVTTINTGVLAASVLANGGSSSSIGAASNAASNLVFGAPGAVLRYTGSTDVITDRSFTTSSGTGGGASISSSGTGTLSFDNTVAIDFGTTAQTRSLTIGSTNTGLNTFSKTITNNGGSATTLTKNGVGRWVLDGANSYSGGTTIDEGALRITNGASLGTTGGNTAINNIGVLELAGGISTNEPISTTAAGSAAAADRIVNVSGNNTLGGNIGNGTGGNHYGLRSDGGNLTINGNITFPNSSTRNLYLRGNGNGIVHGTITAGTSSTVPLVKEGNGTWTLTATNTYNGNTTVSGGTLSLGQVNTANDASTVSIASGAVLDLAFADTDTVNKLFINGVQQPAGPYTSAHPSGAFSGGGTLQVSSGAGFSSWITGTFANGNTVPGGQQGANDDPDNDGISNLVEYAVAGLDPTVSNGSIGTYSGLTLTFTKRTPLATDISYIIETSPDLQPPWTAQVTHGLGNTDPDISYLLPSGGGKLFARLKVQN